MNDPRIKPIHGIRIMRGNRFDNSKEIHFIKL